MIIVVAILSWEFKSLSVTTSNYTSFYQNLLKDDITSVNILIVGDSIGAGSGASSEESQWTYLLSLYLSAFYNKEINIRNIPIVL